jgi:hypothetical protein
MQSHRLAIAETLPLADALRGEMCGTSITRRHWRRHTTGSAQAEWREADHDHIVLAVAMAVWFGEDQAQQQAGFGLGVPWASEY